MDTLTFELLSSLLSNIEDEAIGQLSQTSKNMRSVTKELKDDVIFYKIRVEKLLSYSIDDSYKGNWKGFYYILIISDSDKAYWLNSALSSAALNENYLAIKVLLADQRVYPSSKNNYAIRRASMDGYLEIVKLFLADQRVDPSDYNNTAIQWASQKGHLEVVKLLLADQRVDPSDKNNEAIREASQNGHLDVVKLLLADPRVDPSDKNNEAIQEASNKGDLEIVKLLLADQRVDPSARNNRAIWLASEYGHQEVVKLLLGSNKINLSVKTKALKELQLKLAKLKCSSGSELSYDMIYDNIKNLSMKSLKELIHIGNQKIQDRDIIMTKYFWWLRLDILYNIKGDPFKLALQLKC